MLTVDIVAEMSVTGKGRIPYPVNTTTLSFNLDKLRGKEDTCSGDWKISRVPSIKNVEPTFFIISASRAPRYPMSDPTRMATYGILGCNSDKTPSLFIPSCSSSRPNWLPSIPGSAHFLAIHHCSPHHNAEASHYPHFGPVDCKKNPGCKIMRLHAECMRTMCHRHCRAAGGCNAKSDVKERLGGNSEKYIFSAY